MVIELRVVQFWSEIMLVISNRTRAARSFDFEITRMISDQITLHSVRLPLLIKQCVVKKYMLILLRYNDIFGYFTAISLYRESRYNDTSL